MINISNMKQLIIYLVFLCNCVLHCKSQISDTTRNPFRVTETTSLKDIQQDGFIFIEDWDGYKVYNKTYGEKDTLNTLFYNNEGGLVMQFVQIQLKEQCIFDVGQIDTACVNLILESLYATGFILEETVSKLIPSSLIYAKSGHLYNLSFQKDHIILRAYFFPYNKERGEN